MIEGYKLFRKGLVNQNDDVLEIGKTYEVEGDIQWNKHGFHFCSNPEDTFGFFAKYDEDVVLTKVVACKDYLLRDDEYYGLYGMYVSRDIRIIRVYSREELIKLVKTRGYKAIVEFLKYVKLSEDEIKQFKGTNEEYDDIIEYYQLKKTDHYELLYNKRKQ